MALQIRQMESGFMETFQRALKVAQLTEPAQLQSRFGGTKISVVSGSGEEPKEIYVPEMQQKIDGDCGEQGAIRKILPNGTIYCKTTTSIKASAILMPPGEKSSFKLTANEDYMTVNTKDKSILFQMPVQISESGFQQSAFAIEASGTSQGDATEVPVGVSVVNITSKNSAHNDGVSCLKQQWGSQYSF